MSTITVQRTKTLTLEDIAPEWAKVVARKPLNPTQLTSEEHSKLLKTEYCIVGEAHKGQPNYCIECAAFSYGSGDYGHYKYFNGTPLTNVGYWPETIPRFVAHWNDNHI